jgi:outer membrane protein assembly factor BamB
MTTRLVTAAVTICSFYAAFAHAQADWRTFGFDRQRTGYNPDEATLSPQTAPQLTLRWSIDLGAPMTAQPIEMNGILYAATWGGIVYALDPNSGNVLWAQQLGTVSQSCGGTFDASGDVVGVLHTLSSDAGNGRIFAISGDGMLHALDAVTGAEWTYSPGFPVQVADPNSGELVWGSPIYSFENGSLYIPIASGCDEGTYYGRIIQIDVLWYDPPQIINAWYVTGQEGPAGGGIWGYGGPSLDPQVAVYTATGNALTDPENYAYADHVVRLDLSLNVQAADGPDLGDNFDSDFGSTPVLYNPPNCPPLLSVMNKNGVLYTYNRDAIASGALQALQIASPSSAGNFVGAVAYDPVFNQVYVGNPTDDAVFAHGLIALAVQRDCTLSPAWQQTVGAEASTVPGIAGNDPVIPPIAANGVVYYATGYDSRVYAFDAAPGNYLWDSGALIQNGIYASPMVVNGLLFVAAFDHKLYAFGLP